MNSLRKYSTGAAAIAESITFEVPAQLEEVRLHLSENGGAENFQIALDSIEGDPWNVVIAAQSMNGIADHIYHPTRPKEFLPGDVLKLTLANAARVTWGLEVIWKNI